MLPAYCAIMAITANIVPHIGNGPLWNYKIWDEAEKCKNYWWTNILFISNLIDIKYQVRLHIVVFNIQRILCYKCTKNINY